MQSATSALETSTTWESRVHFPTSFDTSKYSTKKSGIILSPLRSQSNHQLRHLSHLELRAAKAGAAGQASLPDDHHRQSSAQYCQEALYPGYKIPSLENLRKLIDQLFERPKAALRDKLKRVNSTSIIMDLWSSKTTREYLGISCTGVTEDNEPFNAFLTLRHTQGRHTGAATFAEYKSVVKDWNIINKSFVL